MALIEEADISFQDGLNILSGETGAGKSILIGSINLALGGKAAKGLIRHGASYAYVELTFSINEPIQAVIAHHYGAFAGIEHDFTKRAAVVLGIYFVVTTYNFSKLFVEYFNPAIFSIAGVQSFRQKIAGFFQPNFFVFVHAPANSPREAIA